MSYNPLNITLQSSFFATVEEVKELPPYIRDNHIYIICEDELWANAAVVLAQSWEESKHREGWHYQFRIMPCDAHVEGLPKDIAKRVADGVNIFMPLYTPDRQEKLVLVGKVDGMEHLGLCVGLLMADAQAIQDRYSLQAFVDTFNKDGEKAFEEWNKLLNYKYAKPLSPASSISFKGKYSVKQSSYPFLKNEVIIPKNDIENYELQISRIMGIADTVKKIEKPKSDKELQTAEKDFQYLCETLKVAEKNELLLELSKAIPEQRLCDIWQSVTNREYKGKKSKIRIEVCPKLKTYDGEHIDRLQGDVRTYMVDEDGIRHLLNFANNTAHTVYVMNLIYYKQSRQLQALDITKNREAFVKTYNTIYLGDMDGSEAFDKLMCRVSKNEFDYEGRAKSRCFNSIANAVSDMCRRLNVSSSPYVVDDKRPLTINPNLINIARELKPNLETLTFY